MAPSYLEVGASGKPGAVHTVFPIASQEAFYREVRTGGYPARFVRFETGTHGTPIRMSDWREVLNWMLAN